MCSRALSEACRCSCPSLVVALEYIPSLGLLCSRAFSEADVVALARACSTAVPSRAYLSLLSPEPNLIPYVLYYWTALYCTLQLPIPASGYGLALGSTPRPQGCVRGRARCPPRAETGEAPLGLAGLGSVLLKALGSSGGLASPRMVSPRALAHRSPDLMRAHRHLPEPREQGPISAAPAQPSAHHCTHFPCVTAVT
jgi:hypothetical protein